MYVALRLACVGLLRKIYYILYTHIAAAAAAEAEAAEAEVEAEAAEAAEAEAAEAEAAEACAAQCGRRGMHIARRAG